MDTNHNNCKLCQHAHCVSADVDEYINVYFGEDSEDWFCAHPSFLKETDDADVMEGTKAIEFYVEKKDIVETPKWCPRLNMLNNLKTQEPPTKPKRVHKTYTERNNDIQKAKTLNTFDTLQIGQIYHLPPILTENRSDLFLFKRDTNHIVAYNVDVENNTLGTIRYLYSSMYCVNFLVENKMHNCDLNKLANEANLKEQAYYNCHRGDYQTWD